MGSVIGEITGANGAARDASAAQERAAAASNATQKQIYDQQRQDSSAYRDAGTTALSSLADPNLTKAFSANDYQQSPGYQFQMDQGSQALQRSAAARGGVLSGAAQKELLGYSQGLANQDFQQSRSNFKEDQNQRLGQLSGLAGMGLQATGLTGAAGQNYANNVSQTQMGLGNAQAGAIMGAQNATSGLIGQGIGLGAMGLMGAFGKGTADPTAGVANAAASPITNGGFQLGGGGIGSHGLSVLGTGTSKGVFSDARLKTNIERISKEDMKELRENLRAVKFNYTSPVFGDGDFYGVMAQDLERSKLGRTVVFEDEFGNKKIDVKKAMSLFLASMAEG